MFFFNRRCQCSLISRVNHHTPQIYKYTRKKIVFVFVNLICLLNSMFKISNCQYLFHRIKLRIFFSTHFAINFFRFFFSSFLESICQFIDSNERKKKELGTTDSHTVSKQYRLLQYFL